VRILFTLSLSIITPSLSGKADPFSFRSDRSEAALNAIQNEFKEAKITAIDCDLMDFSSVRNAAEAIKQKFPDGIDVLCNNAGIMADEDKATKDGML
jgi:short-subunit dehydrogenase involved in D-alanine esterification of teichoic acids